MFLCIFHLLLLLAFMPGVHSTSGPMGTDRVLFHPGKSNREVTPTFHRRSKMELFLHSPARLRSIVRKEAKGQLCLLPPNCFLLNCSYHIFIPCVPARALSLSPLSTPLLAFFIHFLSFVPLSCAVCFLMQIHGNDRLHLFSYDLE